MLLDPSGSAPALPDANTLIAAHAAFGDLGNMFFVKPPSDPFRTAAPAPAIELPSPVPVPQVAAGFERPPFQGFPKIARLMREICASEKINGSNALVQVTDWGDVFPGSRNGWLEPGRGDNFGFASWVQGNKSELLSLGVGRHYGEWWGRGIQSGYGLDHRRFSLFNVGRWRSQHQDDVFDEDLIDPAAEYAPMCCHVVPTLYRGMFSSTAIDGVIADLAREGSRAAPGFMRPEGIIVFHTAASVMFKRLIEGDEKPKGLLH